MWFLNAFLAMFGIACGMPLLFVSNRLCRKYVSDPKDKTINARSVELMEERNRIDARKAESLDEISKVLSRADVSIN